MTNYRADLFRKYKKHPVLIGFSLCILLITALVIWRMEEGGDKEKGRKTQIPMVQVTKAVRKDVPVYLEGLGNVQAFNTVVVQSQIQGQLMEVSFQEGQDVHKGDILAKIDPRSYQAQLDQMLANKAKDAAQLENAKHDLERYIRLGTMVSEQMIDTQRAVVRQLEATLHSDEAAINNARTSLSYTIIRAPIDGRTGIRQVDAGNIIRPSDAKGLVVITQLEPISVLFSLPAKHLQAISKESKIQGKLQVTALDSSNKDILGTGVLELVDNQIDQATGTIRLKTTFPNEERLLWPGGFVNVKLLLNNRLNSITVPDFTLQQGPKGSYVFVLTPEGKAVMRMVKVALVEEGTAVIEEGLQEGEQVVSNGADKLEDGEKVTVMAETIPSDRK